MSPAGWHARRSRRSARFNREPPSMIRVALFLLLIGLLAVGAAWLADRPGDVTILWLGRRIETSVLVAAAAIAFIAALAVLLWSAVGFVLRSPRPAARPPHHRRPARAHRAISRRLN